MSAFAGKQTFRTINSSVCLILKADVQLEVTTGSLRPIADFRNKSVHESLADTIYNSPSMGEQTKIRLFSDNQG